MAGGGAANRVVRAAASGVAEEEDPPLSHCVVTRLKELVPIRCGGGGTGEKWSNNGSMGSIHEGGVYEKLLLPSSEER